MEQETVNQLVTEQMKTVLGFAMSRLQNRQEAEELASDILYRMLRSAKSIRDDASFYAFLWRVAENTYADFLRRKYRSAFEPVTEDLPDETTSVEAEVSLRDEMQMLCSHFAMMQVERERTASCGDLPSDGPYTLITGGRGYVWGRCADETDANEMQGIFNGVDAEDGRRTVVAMNFPQNAAAQNVLTNEVDLISCIGVGCFDALPEEWQTVCRRLGYEKDGQPNYAVYTDVEYEQMQPMLADGVEIMAQLLRSASAVSAQIWMEHAPARIRKAAEEVGAAVCPSDSLPTVAETLCETGWLTAVNGLEKPTLCLIAHSRKNGR